MKRMAQKDVEIQITPMLDMAFQLLTFFILTYQPAPVEGQFTMNLLPAAPAIDVSAPEPAPGEAKAAEDMPAALRTLSTLVYANPDGSINHVAIGENEFQTLDELKDKLKAIVADKTLAFDQAVIRADPGLRYEELMKLIDIYAGSEVNITKLSFDEFNPAGGPVL